MPPKMFIVAGPPGSGKSTAFPVAAFGVDFFNADDHAAALNDGSYIDIPGEIRALVNRLFEAFVVDHIERRSSCAFETTLRSAVTFEQAASLFYDLKLRCFVVFDLKMGPFKPEYAGKMNFYLSAADDMLRHADDKPSIGLILCKAKNGIVAEYALRDVAKPLGIAEFKHLEKLPEQLKGTLPTIEEIEAELGRPEVRLEEGLKGTEQ
jgi:hypothetical protein